MCTSQKLTTTKLKFKISPSKSTNSSNSWATHHKLMDINNKSTFISLRSITIKFKFRILLSKSINLKSNSATPLRLMATNNKLIISSFKLITINNKLMSILAKSTATSNKFYPCKETLKA